MGHSEVRNKASRRQRIEFFISFGSPERVNRINNVKPRCCSALKESVFEVRGGLLMLWVFSFYAHSRRIRRSYVHTFLRAIRHLSPFLLPSDRRWSNLSWNLFDRWVRYVLESYFEFLHPCLSTSLQPSTELLFSIAVHCKFLRNRS